MDESIIRCTCCRKVVENYRTHKCNILHYISISELCNIAEKVQKLFPKVTLKRAISRRRLPKQLRYRIADENNGFCTYCEKPLQPNFHIDHFVPVIVGGLDIDSNLVPSCPSCNKKKHGRVLKTWEELELFKKEVKKSSV